MYCPSRRIWLKVVSFERPSLKERCGKFFYQNPVHPSSLNCQLKICRDPGSNRGPLDLQSNALPTELSRLYSIQIVKKILFS
jgi:hypothetical protein